MSLICFSKSNLRRPTLAMIEHCNAIIEKYRAAGMTLTLRQLYYQLVVANIIPNKETSYKHLIWTISNGRLSGLVDWDAIEDRIRKPRKPPEYGNLKDLVEAALWSYRLPRWEGQDHYVELWVEKDALAGVLQPLASEFHVTMMVNRGYSSQSAMFEAAQRFLQHCYDIGDHDYYTELDDDDVPAFQHDEVGDPTRFPTLLYLGDHDPSGEDMVRDIRERLVMFGVRDIEVTKVALTMDQVREYGPPPNPAKMTDCRAAKYVEKFGSQSWEVDALPPEVLAKIIRNIFASLIDKKLMKSIMEREEADKKALRASVDELVK